MSWRKHPVFVGGHRKSGTTMLLNMLDSHPQLSVFPSDSGFFYGYYPLYDTDAYSDEERIQRVIDVMYGALRIDLERLEAFQGRTFDYDALAQRFRERMQDQARHPATLVFEAIAAYRDTIQSPQEDALVGWVEKTTSTEIYASEVFEWFPQARFIHVLRDPRDNYASMKSGWQARYQKYNDSIERLLQSMIDRGGLGMRMAAVNAERFGPDRYRVVRYEDLTQDPETMIRDLCGFMGIEYDDILLKPTLYGLPWRGNNFDGLKFDKASATNVGRWPERITAHEAQVIEFHLNEPMQRWGYAPAFTPAQQADAATQHYKWSNFADRYSIAGQADTFKEVAKKPATA